MPDGGAADTVVLAAAPLSDDLADVGHRRGRAVRSTMASRDYRTVLTVQGVIDFYTGVGREADAARYRALLGDP